MISGSGRSTTFDYSSPGRPHRPSLAERDREVRPALSALSAAVALHHGQGPLVQGRARRCRARRGQGRLTRPGAQGDLSPAPPDGSARDLLARRQ